MQMDWKTNYFKKLAQPYEFFQTFYESFKLKKEEFFSTLWQSWPNDEIKQEQKWFAKNIILPLEKN